jgi:hypothetical protein
MSAKKISPAKVKKPAMKDVGRDPETGYVIQHERSDKVAALVSFQTAAGLSLNDIAVMLDIRPGKLKEIYGKELECGLNTANVQVAKAMYDQATQGDVTAGKFWLKARAGWKDGESSGAQASPLSIHIHE